MTDAESAAIPLRLPEQIPTLRCFAGDYYLPFVQAGKKSWKTDERYLAKYILPHLGDCPLDIICPQTITAWLLSLKKSGLSDSSCSRVFWLLKYVLNCAVRWRILESDAGFRDAVCPKTPSHRPPNVLSFEELNRLVGALKSHADLPGARAIHLLLLTGAGKSEILSARWENVHLRQAVLEARTTYTDRPRLIPLNSEAIRLIRTLPRKKDVPWLFTSSSGRRITSLFYTWNLLRNEIGRPELRLQDLRHSFADMLLSRGLKKSRLHDLMGHYLPGTLFQMKNSAMLEKEFA